MKTTLITLAMSISVGLFAQDIFSTKTAQIHFFSDNPVEKIEATNNEASSLLKKDGDMAFNVLIKGFKFERALMQEHFNENYMESDKFPKASFKGKITNPEVINWEKDGDYKVKVSGDLTIHGETQKVNHDAVISIKSGKVSGKSKFKVKCADYKIAIPSVVKDKIAESIDVTVESKYEPFKK
jgi:hypothetical protein